MLLIQDTIVSLEVLEKEFCCDLDNCKGCCCIEGDAGAPVTPEEEGRLRAMLPELLPMMTIEARQVVEQEGIAYNDPSGERVLQIVNDKDCIFARTDHNGWCYCVIERLYNQQSGANSQNSAGRTQSVGFKKWDICHSSRQLGHKLHLPLYKFLKEPLVRRFGQDWYNELCLTAEEWKKQMKNER